MSIATQYAKPFDAPLVMDNGGAVLNIMHRRYGATEAAGVVSNPETALENALDDLLTRFDGRGRIVLAPGYDYQFAAACAISSTDFADGHEVEIDCTGAKLTALDAFPILQRLPANTTEADTGIGARFYIKGGLWVGDGLTAGQMGIQLGATYGSVIERAYFQNFDTAVDVEFGLMATIRYCRAFGSLTDSFLARYGSWTGATASNSGSNSTTFERCRVYGKAGANSQFKVMGSSGCVVDDCITEGENTVYNVEMDSDLATTVKDFAVRNLHSENDPTGAVVKVKISGGVVKIDGIFHQFPNPVLVDMTGSNGAPQVLVSNLYYDPGGVQCTNASCKWTFDNFPTTVDPHTTGFWTAASVPGGVYTRGRATTGTSVSHKTDFYNFAGRFTQTGDFWFANDNTDNIGEFNGARPYGVHVGTEFTLAGGAKLFGCTNGYASLNFGSIAAGGYEDLTMTLTGVGVGGGLNWIVFAAPYAVTDEVGLVLKARVSAANTVTIRAENHSTAAIDPGARNYSVIAFSLVP